MQILLRTYGDEQYVWMQSKYDEGRFVVNGEEINETNIVSIINDNRKNYVQCPCCGKVFRRGSHKFEDHARDAASPKVCFNCPYVCASNVQTTKSEYIINTDGTYSKKIEQNVQLECSRGYLRSYPRIDSITAIANCKLRQCEDATEKEIEDIFTLCPGVFDDIITVDKILDIGYVGIPERLYQHTLYKLNTTYDITAYVNSLSIVDQFIIDVDDWSSSVWYSKKYDEIFMNVEGRYAPWTSCGLTTQQREEIKEIFANLYR